MPENENIQTLIEQNQYIKVFNYFHDEYTKTLKNFLIRHDINISEDDCLINYIIKIRMFMPEYKKYTTIITNVYNEDTTEEEKLDKLITSYSEIKEAFSR